MSYTPLLPTGMVARQLGLSVARVRQLDERLRPYHSADGRRLYDPDVVEAYRAERDAARAQRAERAA